VLAHRVQAPAPAKFIFTEIENIFLIDIYYEYATKTFHKALVLFDLFFSAANILF
jgi:hypothetical protein